MIFASHHIKSTIALVGAIGFTATAYANDSHFNQLLKGDYAFTQAEVCVVTSSEAPVIPTFDRNTLELLGDAEVESLQSRGISRFDGAGSFTSTSTGIGISHGQTQAGDFPVGAPVEVVCEGNYSVSADRSFELNYSCILPDAGVQFAPRSLHGRISVDTKTLIFADTEPLVEEISIIGPGIVVAERVCTATATDAKLIPTRN